MALVVFMLHVKRSERGFDGPEEADAPAAPDDVECWSTLSRLSLPDLYGKKISCKAVQRRQSGLRYHEF
jgi:hypothetical protein